MCNLMGCQARHVSTQYSAGNHETSKLTPCINEYSPENPTRVLVRVRPAFTGQQGCAAQLKWQQPNALHVFYAVLDCPTN